MKRFLIGIFAALLSVAAFGTTLNPIQLLNPVGSTSGQAIVSTGASTAPAWGGIGVNGITALAANTVLANATASSASPTAFAMPSCSAAASALTWTTSTGFTCNAALITAATAASTYATIAQATTALAATGGSINGVTTGITTPLAGKFTTLQATTSMSLVNLVSSATAPTISGGFGTSPSIIVSNGTAAFEIHIGTGGTAVSGTVGLPTAANGWQCDATDITTVSATVFQTKQITMTTTAAGLVNYNTSGAQAAWVAGDTLVVKCTAF